jgi:hypothetical protein
MEDIIFGVYVTDELKLILHHAQRRGLQHRHAISPADPKPGEPVTLSVWVGTDVSFDHLACYYTTEAAAPQGTYGTAIRGAVAHFAPIETVWDTFNWGYLVRWEAALPGQPDGTIVQYRIGAWNDGSEECFADFPDAKELAEMATDAYFHGRPFETPQAIPPTIGKVFAYSVDNFAPPAWARDTVIYQVLVDRFYPGDGKDWLQTDTLDRAMGGTLWGLRDKLGYIADLGVNCIWLSPSWPSYSVHGYDVIDFTRTAEMLGGDAGLRALIEAAHQRGIRVLLDLPCNHISHQSPTFLAALNDPKHENRGWFTFEDTAIGYKAYFNVPSMPVVNLNTPAARDWMIGVARYWLREFGIDGYRLDYANGPSPDFWSYFNAACKAENPDCFCFGEIVEAPESLRSYVGRLDGALDFYAEDLFRQTYALKNRTEAEFERALARHQAYFPAQFLMPTFIDNHDINRFLYLANGDKDALRAALRRQLAMPNPPIIYYGTEVGLSHPKGTHEAGLEAGRVAMPWDERQDRALLADVAGMIHARRAGT